MLAPPAAVVEGMLPILIGLFWFLMVASLAYWVSADAAAHGSAQPRTWALASVVTPIGLPYYLYKRRHLRPRQQPPSRRERWAAVWAIATVSAFLLSSLFGPPDPFTHVRNWAVLTSVFLPVAYLLSIHTHR